MGEIDERVTVVCEASSFQLEDTIEFAPEAAVLLNVAPDHLDRHGTLEAYLRAKLRMFANQGPGDVAVAPADLAQGPAGLGIEHHHCHLRQRHLRSAVQLTAPLPLGVGFLNPDPHRLDGVALQGHIQSGIHAERNVLEIVILKTILQGFIHQIDEERGIGRFRCALHHVERGSRGVLILLLGQIAVLMHGLQNQVAPGARPLRETEWIAADRRLNQSRQQGRVRCGDLIQILGQVDRGSLAETVDAEASLMA